MTSAPPLHGRTALIAGSSSGTGRGVALAFARAGAGAAVIINHPAEADRDAGEAIASEVRSLGAQSRAVRAGFANMLRA